MSDLNELSSASTTKIVGAGTTGDELGFIGSNNGFLKTTSVDSEPVTATAVCTDINLALNKSLLAIFNNSTSVVRVREIWLTVVEGAIIPSTSILFEMYRFSGISGGTEIVSQLYDTADSIDANIKCYTNATITGESATALDTAYWTADDALTGGTGAAVERSLQNQFPYWAQTNNSKPIVLRQGQGLHLKCRTNTNTGQFSVRFIYTV